MSIAKGETIIEDEVEIACETMYFFRFWMRLRMKNPSLYFALFLTSRSNEREVNKGTDSTSHFTYSITGPNEKNLLLLSTPSDFALQRHR